MYKHIGTSALSDYVFLIDTLFSSANIERYRNEIKSILFKIWTSHVFLYKSHWQKVLNFPVCYSGDSGDIVHSALCIIFVEIRTISSSYFLLFYINEKYDTTLFRVNKVASTYFVVMDSGYLLLFCLLYSSLQKYKFILINPWLLWYKFVQNNDMLQKLSST